MFQFIPPPCEDCGPHTVFHRFEYFDALTSEISALYLSCYEKGGYFLSHLIDSTSVDAFYLAFIQKMTQAGFGSLHHDPHPHECSRTKALREEAQRRGIDFQDFRTSNQESNHFFASWKGETIAFEGVPRPKGQRVQRWMDKKDQMRQAFIRTGILVANGGVYFSWKNLLKKFESLEKPVIIKPHLGSRSRHTTIHIETPEQLRVAFEKAKQLSPWVIIEEELVGSLFRGTVIGGKMIAILRRDAPCVIGDGQKTIRQLVEEENKQSYRHNGVFEPIPMDRDAEQELIRQGYTWNSAPPSGQRVILNPKFGRGQGSLNEDVTDQAHPDNIQLLEEAARVINDPLIGMDFIMSDISRSWKNQKRCGIIECNSAPFIDIHQYPFKGTPRNTAGALWDLVFPGSSLSENHSVL